MDLDAIIAQVAPEVKEQAIKEVKKLVLAKLETMDSQELADKVVEYLNKKIDDTDMKGLPDNIIDPIVKKVVAAYVGKGIVSGIEAAKTKLAE